MESSAPQSNLESRYELQQLLGSGGAGKVYKAYDKSLRRNVAIKRFGSEFGPATTSDEQAWREAMTLASIQHPNILTVFDFGVDEQGPYVITEFLEGETLDKVIQRGPLHLKDFRDLAQQTLEALIAAHQIGLIHRDLKPQNIMVLHLASGAKQYKILDFGLAKIVQEPRAQTMIGDHTIVGSIFYIAPEQLSRKPVDARSDLYSMGCVYYNALTGHNAFEGESVTEIIASHIRHRVVPLTKRRAEIPQPLADWVMKFIQLQPEHRWQSAAEALAALHKLPSAKTILIKSGPIAVPPEAAAAKPPTAPVPQPAVPSKWTASRISIVVGTVVLAVLLAATAIQRGNRQKAASVKADSAGVVKKAAPVPPVQSVSKPAPAIPVKTQTAPSKTPQAASKAAPAPAAPSRPASQPVAYAPPAAPGGSAVDLSVTAPVVWANEMDKIRSYLGQEAAVRGRMADVRSKGDELWVVFEGQDMNTLAAVFPLEKEKREEVLKYARSHKNQMLCLQGVIEQRGQQLVIRAKDIRQLDALPPL
jgi:serine/threonine protein kinase